MTQRDDFDPRIAGWLADVAGEHASPELVDGVLHVTSLRRPRPSWLARLGGHHLTSTTTRPGVLRLRKDSSMNSRAPVLAAIAGIAVIAVVGFAILAPRTQPAPGVAGASGAAPTATPSSTATPSATPAPSRSPTPAPTYPANIEDVPGSAPLEPGTYYIDPDGLGVRVHYTVAGDGWIPWVGAGKPTEDGVVGLSIVNVTNVVADGCTDHTPKDPPVGPTVDDLATALARLEPFEATVAPRDVEAYGYAGKYLELTLTDIATELVGDDTWFSDCDNGQVHSWMSAPVTSYWAYSETGQVEAYWILDVDGQRLVISSGRTPNVSAEDLAELQAMLDSITIETR